MLTNETVQIRLREAVEKLDSLPIPKDEVDAGLLLLLRGTLHNGRLFCASGNPIPGLGGRGLQELLTLADQVMDPAFRGDRVRPHYKQLALAFL